LISHQALSDFRTQLLQASFRQLGFLIIVSLGPEYQLQNQLPFEHLSLILPLRQGQLMDWLQLVQFKHFIGQHYRLVPIC
jgi:hypothetical protein